MLIFIIIYVFVIVVYCFCRYIHDYFFKLPLKPLYHFSLYYICYLYSFYIIPNNRLHDQLFTI